VFGPCVVRDAAEYAFIKIKTRRLWRCAPNPRPNVTRPPLRTTTLRAALRAVLGRGRAEGQHRPRSVPPHLSAYPPGSSVGHGWGAPRPDL
jgi:hypothetical protein